MRLRIIVYFDADGTGNLNFPYDDQIEYRDATIVPRVGEKFVATKVSKEDPIPTTRFMGYVKEVVYNYVGGDGQPSDMCVSVIVSGDMEP